MTTTPAPARRMLAPDLARGYMLLLIALANVPAFATANTIFLTWPKDTDVFSRVMEALATLFADGRAYPLFAMLFGFGLAVLTRRRLDAGQSPSQIRRYLLVRMLWLLAFGAVHGLFFPGDIMGAYALAGLIMVPLVLAPLWVNWLIAGISGFLWLLSTGGNAIAMGLVGPDMGTGSGFGMDSFMETTGYNPLFNLVGWLFGSIAGALFAALPFVILGSLAGRFGWLSDTPDGVRRARLVAGVGLGLGLLSGLPGAAAQLGLIGGEGWWVGLAYLAGPVMAVGYLALAVLIGHQVGRKPGPVSKALTATGQRSMTCYLLQTVLFLLLLAPMGPLGLADHFSSGQERLFATGVWAVTVIIALLLARAGKPGPADALLRRLSTRRRPVAQPVAG